MRMPIHPGEHIAEELRAMDINAAELARRLDVPTNRITQIINGTRDITADTALHLTRFFGTSAQFWMNLQSLHDVVPGTAWYRLGPESHQAPPPYRIHTRIG